MKLTKEIMEALDFEKQNGKWKHKNEIIEFQNLPDAEEFLKTIRMKYIKKGMGLKTEQIKRILEV